MMALLLKVLLALLSGVLDIYLARFRSTFSFILGSLIHDNRILTKQNFFLGSYIQLDNIYLTFVIYLHSLP